MGMEIGSIAWAQGMAPEGASGLFSLVPFILIFVVFYFLLILPQQRKQKQHKEMLTKLKKGDKVITSAGMWGSITRLDKETATVQVDDNTKVKIQRENISRLRAEDEG